ncbi:phosphoribosylaminoimidazolesuccinocarboxamide synthase [Schaalia sp. ZJ405]|uniref:phosphoribosylaminoimidazolesuccinocarboxamide synthase n=1 Tax=Schaalia sp. ZJ405 TaxID=2709403 RepID=UPI0013EB9DDF|nr:phosphoribosylaminoimidazolesuccinocarboxamide synthase [Schaalia sp. ZJ405]QPK81092.1 phosphoribosylaminoimidazolesuccinocarboxamide synthase [Schaalia sp. ZJ405]
MDNLELSGWTHLSAGKVREIYVPASTSAEGATSHSEDVTSVDAGAPRAAHDRLLMVTTDRISAYDVILPTLIPDKGKILNQLAIWWMGQMSDIVDNHLIATDAPDVPEQVAGRAVVCKALDMIPIECVVRGYLTGSGLVEYREKRAVCGVPLPPGLTEASRLEQPVFTPAAKAEVGDHDENITFDRAAQMVGRDVAEKLRDLSLAIYDKARSIAAERGVILADTKFEFGIDPESGKIVLADEILTPDSSRFWPADQWVEGHATPSFDKQYLRDWLTSPASGWEKSSSEQPPQLPQDVVAATRDRYIEAFKRITGTEPVLS